MIRPKYQKQDLQIERKKSLYSGFFSMSKYRLKHKLFAGGWSSAIEREIFDRGEAAAVLLYDAKANVVVLTEQFRVGAIGQNSPWIFELVAGMIEPGENPEAVAIREAQEETGAIIDSLMPICQYLVSPGGTNEKLHVFLALLDSQPVSGIHGLSEEGEDILVHKVPTQQAFDMVKNGQINNAATIIALQWLELNLERLSMPG
mgnify:CR=1 FL=1